MISLLLAILIFSQCLKILVWCFNQEHQDIVLIFYELTVLTHSENCIKNDNIPKE
jgi:hypothetical protein